MGRLISFCSSTGKNTGGIDCDVQLGNLKWALIGSAKFLPSEYATEAALKTAILDRINRANGDAEKLYPWALSNGIDKNTAEDTTETAPDGTTRTIRVAPESYTLNQWGVGVNQEAAMIQFNNATIPAFLFDDTFKMVGKYDGDLNFVGNKVKLNTKGAGFGTFAAGPNTRTTLNFVDPFALNVNARLFEFTAFDFEDYEGLLDAELRTLVAPTGNAHKIGVFVPNKSIGKDVNLYDEYSTELADVDVWEGETAAGAIVAPTTVVVDAVNEGWTVTFGVAVAIIRLKDPSVLNTNNVTGIEGIDLAI
jgi:hypothetical protein